MKNTIHPAGAGFRSVHSFVLAAGLTAGLLVTAVSAHAQVLMDQIGDGTTIDEAYYSQIFEPASAAKDTAVIDDFTVSGATQIAEVDVFGYFINGSATYTDVTGYEVNVYSSVAAANSSLTGDIASVSVAPGSVTVDGSFSPTNSFAGNTDLISIPVSLSLPAAGTYWVGVSVDMTSVNGFGVAVETTATVDNPGGDNAFDANPNGGFGGTANVSADAAYRVIAVPEPATWGVLAGVAALGLAACSRRRRA